jgi:hypothetical protein
MDENLHLRFHARLADVIDEPLRANRAIESIVLGNVQCGHES